MNVMKNAGAGNKNQKPKNHCRCFYRPCFSYIIGYFADLRQSPVFVGRRCRNRRGKRSYGLMLLRCRKELQKKMRLKPQPGKRLYQMYNESVGSVKIGQSHTMSPRGESEAAFRA
jgi:hypothetical protein